jgi:membrane protein
MGRLISALREAGLRFSNDGCAFLAQAVAFNAIFALFPLLVLTLTVASFIFPFAQGRVLNFLGTFSPTLHEFVATNLETYIYGRGISSIVAVVFLIWSGKNLFMGIGFALDRALSVPKGRPFIHNVALSIVMLPVIGLILIVAMALPIVISVVMFIAQVPDRQYLTHFSAYAISLLLVFAVTTLLYRLLPNRHISWGFSLPGALLVASLWPIVQLGFTQYTLHVNFAGIYGALSVPLALLLWFYMIGSLFFFGAEFSAAWHARSQETLPMVGDLLETLPEARHAER